jgi:acetyl-CoA acetyltransferase
MSLRGSVAIVGAADTAVGRVPDKDATELCVEAALRALADAGLAKDCVDGLVTCNSMAQPRMYHAEAIAEYLQIFPRWCLSANAGGGTTFSVIAQAAAAIRAGLGETVVVAMADSLRSSGSRARRRGDAIVRRASG